MEPVGTDPLPELADVETAAKKEKNQVANDGRLARFVLDDRHWSGL